MTLAIHRRRFLILAGSGTAAAAAAGAGLVVARRAGDTSTNAGTTSVVGPGDPIVGRIEQQRRRAGARVVQR